MDDDIDHYVILGLPSGEEGFKLSEKEITKAYRLKALELHPDKRPDDPNAPANFQKLQTSYQILKDEKARKLFHDLLRVKQQKLQRQSQQDSKRRRMMSDLEERERSAYAAQDASAKATSEEESIARKLKEEINRIRAMHANKFAPTPPTTKKKQSGVGETSNTGPSAAEKEKMLKVSWEKGGFDYSAQRLREIFEDFGEVKDVVIRSQKKKGSALIVMGTKEAAMAATGTMCGDISNPLLVVRLQPAVATTFTMSREPVVPQQNEDLVGAGYQAFEDSVLQKLQKVHAASLIHDDLPCMDDDPSRRGQPSNHTVFGMDMAILAGDALFPLGFRHIVSHTPTNLVPETQLLRVINEIARAVGFTGMAAGQFVDLEGPANAIDFIHEKKYGEMGECSAVCGGLLAGANDDEIQRLRRYGRAVGILYQVVDDVLQAKSSKAKLGDAEKVGEEKKEKSYVGSYGIEKALKVAENLRAEAKNALEGFEKYGEKVLPLYSFVDYAADRSFSFADQV